MILLSWCIYCNSSILKLLFTNKLHFTRLFTISLLLCPCCRRSTIQHILVLGHDKFVAPDAASVIFRTRNYGVAAVVKRT